MRLKRMPYDIAMCRDAKRINSTQCKTCHRNADRFAPSPYPVTYFIHRADQWEAAEANNCPHYWEEKA